MASLRTPGDVEEFWDDLLAFIETGRVIPVVGAELLMAGGSFEIPLYRAVAERLLEKYEDSAGPLSRGTTLHPYNELHDAVCILAAGGKRVKELYRPIHDILKNLLADQEEPLPALRELASIRHFDLFVTTTPDDLLARALDSVRTQEMAPTDQVQYAPLLPTETRLRDIPEVQAPGYRAVFYMFGKAHVSPFYAIHDEDALEFAYKLQQTQIGEPPFRMFTEMRSRNLLFIGCNFPDWFSRFFLRLSNEKRLSSEERPKKEFLIDQVIGQDGNLTVFLERFSRDSRVFPMPAREFVAELYQRWQKRNPTPPPRDDHGNGSGRGRGRPISPAAASIFISYASEDIAAARQLFEELRPLGAEVIWFDKDALRPGDEWREKIRIAVECCGLFLPLISTNTEAIPESEFRREWRQAANRLEIIQGQKLVFPVVVDAEFDGNVDRYARVPEAFKDLQYSHAPAGRTSPELLNELREQLHLRRQGRFA
jgi:hypothetical protein